ncbi:MAG: VWA domain-containing protein [Pirellula sp.]|nr:VWA domain-containing protein [Pirellula sp.]
MTLGTPLALLLALIAIPIVIFYILKVRLRRVPVSTNLFWNQIFEDKPPKSLWQNLRYWLSLLAQLLILALLVLAIADPILSWQTKGARRLVLVMDVSASMQAAEKATTRFDSAKQAAQRVLDGVREQDQVAILTAGTGPEVVLGMGNHVPSLRRAINDLLPVDTPANLGSAVELANQLLGDAPNGQVIVFTDQDTPKSTNPDNQAKETNTVEYRAFGANASNVGITQFQSRRSMADALGYELLVEVSNASDLPIQCRLEIELDERPVDIFPLKLQPNETWSRTLEKASVEGGALKATLSKFENDQGQDRAKNNNLDVDDIAWAILPDRVIQPVLIVSPGNLFLQKVFEANPLVRVTVQKEIPTAWPENAVIVLHKLIPDPLPSNPLFIIDPDTSSSLFRVDGLIDSPLVTEQDKDSPLMTHVRLDNVMFPNTKKLTFLPQTAKPVASCVGGESLFATLTHGDKKAVVLGVNLEQSDLAFRTVFPILASNAIAWFSSQSGELSLAIAGGDTARLNRSLSAGVPPENLWLISPGLQVKRQSGSTVGPLKETGVWELFEWDANGNPTAENLRTTGKLVDRYAVNLESSSETDLRNTNDSDRAPKQTSIASWFSYPPWYYLAILIGSLLVIEWGMYQRRVLA